MITKILILICFGRYNSFRVATVAMQEITELFQFVFGVELPSIV